MKPTLYPNGFPSAYEELKTFYPVFYRDVFEMDAIWRSSGGGLDEIEDSVDRVANSTFISTMDEEALAQLEVFLGIPRDSSRTLAERRKLAAAYFLGTGHFGAEEIKEIARAFTEGVCEVSFYDSTVFIHIKADIADTPPADDFYFILRRKIPAHLGVNTEVEIEFTTNLFVGSNTFQNDRYSVNPEKLKQLSASSDVHTGTAVMQSDRYAVQPQPQTGLSFETEVLGAMAMAEHSRYEINLTLAQNQLEATATPLTGGAVVENTHYIVQTQGGV